MNNKNLRHTSHLKFSKLSTAIVSAIATTLCLSSVVLPNDAKAQEVPIVQPGAPGQQSKTLSAEQAIALSNTSFTRDDVLFMQNMIPHHGQAVDMGLLVDARTNNPEIIDIAGRIKRSQDDEIAFMSRWLEERGQASEIAHHMHMDHSMMGMATPEQMQQLAASKGTDFDRLFLTLMIPHHEGAIRMVEDLLDQPGSAYDPILYDFVNDIVNDQEAEIERMNELLAGLSNDPRVGLQAGFRDAGEAISNLSLVATLQKPAGFFDPENPSNIPPIRLSRDDDDKDVAPAMDHSNHAMHADVKNLEDEDFDVPEFSDHLIPEDLAAEARKRASGATESIPSAHEHAQHQMPERSSDADSDEKTEYSERWPLLSFWNTDMAFANDILVAGNYHGFNVYQLNYDGIPSLKSSIVCPGGQGDVSIVGDLLIMSVEQTRGRIDCGLEGINEDISDERFRGLRIFDISDVTRPVQVGLVQTCRGSHTHSVVRADDENIIVYNSGTSSVRDEEELAGCVGEVPGDERTALFRIDVVEIPVNDPASARITSSPAVFADDEGRVAGLWLGGDHGAGTQDTRPTDECHDITVFPSLNIAAGACSGNGILFDISDPYNPTRIDDVKDPGFAYWHSATFNNDGTKVLFTDEWGGGTQPRCRASDPVTWGANAIYNIVDGKLEFQSYYKIDAPQSDQENCVAHNGSLIPVPGRDIFAQAWYQGGLSISDFTDAANPQEIAYFDRGPIHDEQIVVGGYWSTYWFDGKIYGTEIVRGLDVFELKPSEHLTENEIAAAEIANMGKVFNPQQQLPVSWPAVPVVAMAYVDQLHRDFGLSEQVHQEAMAMLKRAQKHLDNGDKDDDFADELENMADSFDIQSAHGKSRLEALKDTLSNISKKLS
ncbi:DUF305 domain-containing protein [Ningiella sp. W23]|uniref:DUF305 domain-containing protein n=1 Tax=Ningiella sp. W23 TaxID=3023715 RepID=UPI0037580F96